MSYLLTSDLKQRTAKVLAAALKKPQFVFRDGEVFVIRRVVLTDVPDSGEGDMARVIADTWDKLGPAPEIDYDEHQEGHVLGIAGVDQAKVQRRLGVLPPERLDAVLKTLCRIVGIESKHLAP